MNEKKEYKGRSKKEKKEKKQAAAAEAGDSERNRDTVERIIYHLVLVLSLFYPLLSFFWRKNWKIIHCPGFEDWL